MNTEITDVKAEAGLVCYDGKCALCRGWARRFEGPLRRAGFALATLPPHQTGAEPAEMELRTSDGRHFGGADALVQIARNIWWARPLFALAQIPGATPILRAGYRRLAANRHCLGGACRTAPQRQHGVTAFFEMP